MALNGKFISFQPIIESVYRRAGYQSIDWAEAIEIIGETIKLIGALPAFGNVTTNGVGSNPNPLEVQDYRVVLPTDFVSLEAARKIHLVKDVDGSLSISSFSPMVESTNLFYKSIRKEWNEAISPGTYDYEEFKHLNTIYLSGTTGSAIIGGPTTVIIPFTSDLNTTAEAFVLANKTVYDALGIVISNDQNKIIFKSKVSGVDFVNVTIETASGDLTGIVEVGSSKMGIQVYSPVYYRPNEKIYEFKIDNDYIYTNFQEGYIELSYKSFILDEHGFPMIPDDERFINAIKWSIIEQLDYKKWRLAEISDKVYAKSEQERLFYITSARSKANIPSPQKMEALKNMFLRSVIKVTSYNDYFKYSNIMERRYSQNNK